MLRIHFAAEDLAKIRVMAEPHPMWEMLLSLHLLQTQHGTQFFGAWRHRTRAVLPPSTEPLTVLARPKGYSPDFLTPPISVPDLDTGIDYLLSTPRMQLRADIAQLADQRPVPPWVGGIASGETAVMRRLAQALRRYHAEALEPHWPSIRAHIQADRALRANIAMDGGFERVLSTLHPAIRWRSPVLEVAYPVEQDLYLGGRGLVLAPSFFCWRTPITLCDPTRPPMLVYPVERDLGWMAGTSTLNQALPSSNPQALGALIGKTRATVLQTIAAIPHVNTTELAKSIGISPAGASQHTTVLRNAGLVTTQRHNGSAVHRVSPRGAALLERSLVTAPSTAEEVNAVLRA